LKWSRSDEECRKKARFLSSHSGAGLAESGSRLTVFFFRRVGFNDTTEVFRLSAKITALFYSPGHRRRERIAGSRKQLRDAAF